MKGLVFLGTARDDLKAFPNQARRKAGAELRLVQSGQMPTDWRPMRSIGSGVVEIRINAVAGAFRVVYVAKIGDDVIVLHCFQKKSMRTARGDIAIATIRYMEFLRGRRR